ncbi:MAG: AbrB/MazE/SpoVT family DNA-binding domain-containing protein [Anaerolineales bacterium]
MFIVKMSTRGRVTIPEEIREKLQLLPGDKLAFIETEKGVLLQPVKSLEDLKGTVAVDAPQDFEQIREETKKRRGENRGE